MPKIGVEILVYHATQYLEKVLKQYEWVDRIAVLNYRFPLVEPIEDNTEDIVRSFKHPGIILKQGEGLQQNEIRNVGMEALKDCDAIIISDADEFIFAPDQQKLLQPILNKSVDYVNCKIVDYNGDLNHASPERPYLVTVAVSPRVRFWRLRCIDPKVKCVGRDDVTMHHVGLVFAPDVISWKSEWEPKEEGHSKEKILDDWAVKREVTPPQELLEILKDE